MQLYVNAWVCMYVRVVRTNVYVYIPYIHMHLLVAKKRDFKNCYYNI